MGNQNLSISLLSFLVLWHLFSFFQGSNSTHLFFYNTGGGSHPPQWPQVHAQDGLVGKLPAPMSLSAGVHCHVSHMCVQYPTARQSRNEPQSMPRPQSGPHGWLVIPAMHCGVPPTKARGSRSIPQQLSFSPWWRKHLHKNKRFFPQVQFSLLHSVSSEHKPACKQSHPFVYPVNS